MTKPSKEALLKEAQAAVQEDRLVGFCTACGAEHDCIDPDSEEGECEACGEEKVYGAEQLVLMLCSF